MTATPITTFISRGGLDTFLEFDANVSENHEADVEVTEHQVEVGADVSDHARLKSRVLTLQGIISNTPVNHAQQRRIIVSQGVQFESTSLNDAVGYAEEAFAKFLELRESRQRVTVRSVLWTYRDMMLTSFKAPKDAKTGDALAFTVVFKEIRFAELQKKVVTVAKETKAKVKVSLGKQAASATGAEQERSILHHLVGAATGNDSAGTDKFIGDKLSPEAAGVK